jgi:CcmD family protein
MYLFLAFAAFWLIFMLYAWLLSRRQAQLQRELEELKSRFPKQPPVEHNGK